MILKLWVHRLWRSRLWLLYNPNPRPYARPIPTPGNRSPNSSPYRITSSCPSIRRRCTTLLGRPIPRRENRRSAGPTKPNGLHCLTPRCILRTVFWNLRGKPQLYAHCSWSSPTRALRELILINTRRRLTRKLIIGQSVGLLSQSLVPTDHL